MSSSTVKENKLNSVEVRCLWGATPRDLVHIWAPDVVRLRFQSHRSTTVPTRSLGLWAPALHTTPHGRVIVRPYWARAPAGRAHFET